MRCRRCVCDSSLPNIMFDSQGVCSYCHSYEMFEKQYPVSNELEKQTINMLKHEGKHSMYDAVIGVSGGCDSSYLLYKLTKMGVRLLAVHWDNNWNTDIADNNIQKLVGELGVDNIHFKVNQIEYDDLCRSFLLASTPDADIPNDIALTTVLYQAADSFNIPFIINGHSFRTEGFAPLGWTYMDGGYIEDVHKRYGRVPLKTFPNLTLEKWLPWIQKKIKRVRPLYNMNYQKDTVVNQVLPRLGWEWYNGHHMENKYTIFVGNYLWPKKFNIDFRIIEYSALIRSKQMNRDEALELLSKTPMCPDHIVYEVMKRLRLSRKQLDDILTMPIKTYRDYNTYQKYFKKNKDLFTDYYEQGLIPKTFYEKYVVGI